MSIYTHFSWARTGSIPPLFRTGFSTAFTIENQDLPDTLARHQFTVLSEAERSVGYQYAGCVQSRSGHRNLIRTCPASKQALPWTKVWTN
jgi:hypothetical protein